VSAPVELASEIRGHGEGRGTLQALLKMAWPSTATGWVKASYSIADIWCAGRISTTALASLAAAVLFVWTFHSMSQTNSTGALSLVSRAIGAGDRARAAALIRRAAILGLGLGVFASACVILLVHVALPHLSLSEDVQAGVSRYLLWIAALGPGLYLYDTLEQAFRALGRPRAPLVVFGAFALLNLALNPLLALGLGLGLVGIAISTGFAWWGAALVLLYMARRAGVLDDPSRERVPAWHLWRIGLPTALAGVAFDLIWVLILPVLAGLDEAALAAVTVAHRLESVSYLTGVGLSMACAALVGQAVGLGRTDLARKVTATAATAGFAFAGLWVSAMLLWGDHAMRLFTDDERVVAHGVDYFVLASIPIAIQAAESVYVGAFAGTGRTWIPSIVSFVCYGARVPLARVGAAAAGVAGVFAAIGATAAASGLLIAGLFIAVGTRYARRS
jgi:putative MATE family efflux protein